MVPPSCLGEWVPFGGGSFGGFSFVGGSFVFEKDGLVGGIDGGYVEEEEGVGFEEGGE